MSVQSSAITLDTMSIRVKQTLDALLKYGTVFLVYRLCSYYFFDCGKSGASFFDTESSKLIIFLLIGFTIYYMFVKPYIPINLEHPIMRNLTNDMLMFGTVLVSSHILDVIFNKGDLFDKQWIKTAGIILLAFAAYDIIIYPFVPLTTANATTKPMVNDWIKFGSFLIIFQILQCKSIADTKFILSVLFVLLGFAGYNLITKKLIKIDFNLERSN
jgi:hypothetical protein